MKKIFRLVVFWILLFLPVTVVCSTIIYGLLKFNDRHLNQNINKKIELKNLVDTLGNKVTVNFKSEFTIIDFWFVGCLPCVSEMRQFNSLLKGREKEISVFSVSIDESQYWKTPNSPFLTKTVNNWEFYKLDSKSIQDKTKYLFDLFNITRFPSYIVVDKKGYVIEAPMSAVSYIKEKFYYKNWILFFWHEMLFTKDYILFQVMFIPYTLLFWLTLFVFSKIKKNSITKREALKNQ